MPPIYDTTIAGVPSRGVVYAKLIEHLREAQECAALMGHLSKTEGSTMDNILGDGWIGISELLKGVGLKVTQMAMNKLQ